MRHFSIMWILLFALCLPNLCLAHARSTFPSSDPENIVKSQLPFPKVPLPPSTTSVKCKCQPQGSTPQQTLTSSNIQSRSDDTETEPDSSSIGKEIEIQIFNPEMKNVGTFKHQSYQKDSSNVAEPISQKSFKSFRTAQLLDPTHEEITALPRLELGKSYGPFEGPRRRRKRDVSSSKKNPKVFYVYSVKFDNSSQQFETSTTTPPPTTTEISGEIPTTPNLFTSFIYPASVSKSQIPNHNHDSISKFSERNIEVDGFQPASKTTSASLTLEHAMSQAWLDYGLKSVPPPKTPHGPPITDTAALQMSPSFLTQHPQNPLFLTPSSSQLLARPPAYSYQFQRQGDFLTSPWDNRMTPNPDRVSSESQPGFFSPLLARYIDFEVNNHEAADFARKLLFAFVIGTLIAAWVALGVGLGIFPLNLLFSGRETEKTRSNLDLLKRNTIGGGGSNDLENVGNRVMLALDPGWLTALEERVKQRSEGNFVRTVAKCCVIPKEERVVCNLGKKDKTSGKVDGDPVTCGSDLIYNFEFGPGEEEEEDEDERVKIRNSI